MDMIEHDYYEQDKCLSNFNIAFFGKWSKINYYIVGTFIFNEPCIMYIGSKRPQVSLRFEIRQKIANEDGEVKNFFLQMSSSLKTNTV